MANKTDTLINILLFTFNLVNNERHHIKYIKYIWTDTGTLSIKISLSYATKRRLNSLYHCYVQLQIHF